MSRLSLTLLVVLAFAPVTACHARTQDRERLITLAVDAREAPRGILHARLAIPAPPGALALRYPQWIPGEHGPTGPINSLTGLKITAGGQPISWRRDPVDMYTFHCTVPDGAQGVDVSLDFMGYTSPSGFTDR